MAALNFSETFNFKFRKDKDNLFIFDITRKIWVPLTPEEWVRQHWIHYFVQVRGFSTSSIISEKKINLFGTYKRIDILVTEKTIPIYLIECKAPYITLDEKTFDQVARYNIAIGAKKIIMSNGLQHIFATYDNQVYTFIQSI